MVVATRQAPIPMVALLRGVNVGGVRLAMADLRAVAAGCGLLDVATYVQSGNVVFRSPDLDPAAVAATLESALAAEAGIETAVTVRTPIGLSTASRASRFAGLSSTSKTAADFGRGIVLPDSIAQASTTAAALRRCSRQRWMTASRRCGSTGLVT